MRHSLLLTAQALGDVFLEKAGGGLFTSAGNVTSDRAAAQSAKRLSFQR
jgi:hypothetical protein